jgi:hypothetical protein
LTRTAFRPAPAAAGVFICALLFALSGCASLGTPPMTAQLTAAPPAALPAQAQVPVPFFAQRDYQCGPAALAMVLAAGGLDVSADQLTPQVYLPAREGSLQPEMLATTRRQGRLAVVLPPRLDALLAEVAAGHPVIVLQNLALPASPVWHYAVVIGYDLPRGAITLHSGVTPRLTMELAVFERTWARSGHWAMAAVLPSQLPLTPSADDLVQATAALERVQPAAALAAYDAIIARHGDVYGAWLGLGNARHAAHDLPGAAAAFVRATEIRPAAADAWNNLALVRLALGRLAEARSAALRAVELGGPRLARYRETLAAVERAAR